MKIFTQPSPNPLQPNRKGLQAINGKLFFSLLVSTFLTFSFFPALAQCELTLTPTNIRTATCGGKDGSFSVQVSGITAPYQYWLYKMVNGSPVLQENGTLIAGMPTFVFLTGGTYKVEIKKGDNCSGEVTVEVPQEELKINLSTFSLPSCPTNDGSFTLDVTGLAYPYQYTLSKQVNGSFTQVATGTQNTGLPTFVGLSGGVYQVALTKGSCTGSFTVYLNCEILGNEGCSPGYWKKQPTAWITTNYTPTQTVESVFDVPDTYGLDNVTLLESLQGEGGADLTGAVRILLRAATAALLNATHGSVDYTIRLSTMIADVNAALASGDRNAILQLANTLDKYNNKNCPLDSKRKTEMVRQPTNPSLLETAASLQVKALPNPSASHFNVQIETAATEKITLRVVDMQGRLLEQRHNVQPGQTIRLGEGYLPGVYLVDIEQGKARKQVKLLKTGRVL